MELIGFNYFTTKEGFEEWQIDNPQNTVFAIYPQMDNITLEKEGKGKREEVSSARTIFGAFVTYKYPRPE